MPAQPVRKLHAVPAPKDHAQPELRFAFEPFYVIARELWPLFRKHWRELGTNRDTIPLDPNWDGIMQQSVAGLCQILTVRDGDKLIGYICNQVSPHIYHKSTLHAWIDNFWLEPRYRRGLTALKMFRTNEAHLRKLGVVCVIVAEKLHWLSPRKKRPRVLFRRMGFKAADVVYTKLLMED
jgi:hypothetical protein